MPDAIADYAELYVRVGDLVKRNDLATIFTSITRLAEARMWRTIRCGPMEKVETLTPDENGVIALPADYLEIRSARPAGGGDGRDLTGMSLHALNARYGRSGGTGRAYAIVGNTLLLRPTGGDVELTYYARPPSLTEQPTNGMLSAYPDLYLFGVAREAALHSRDAQLVQAIDPLFTQALQAVELEDLSRRFAMTAVRLTGPTP
jgi:hypothetical protein